MSDALSQIFSAAPRRVLSPGERLFGRGDAVISVFRVQQGAVFLGRSTPGGIELAMQRAGKGQIVAEASVYSLAYHCDGTADRCGGEVAVLSAGDFRKALASDPLLAQGWARHLAEAVQSARRIAEIRTLRTVSERLEAWLDGNEMPPRGQWQRVALDLGVTREALYRALAERRDTP